MPNWLPKNSFTSPGLHAWCRRMRFSSPGVHAWETRSHRFTSLLQGALSAASAKPIKKPHQWGSRISRAQRVPGVNAWASGKARYYHIQPARRKTFTGFFQSAENRLRNTRPFRWSFLVFVVNLLILAIGLASVV